MSPKQMSACSSMCLYIVFICIAMYLIIQPKGQLKETHFLMNMRYRMMTQGFYKIEMTK